MYKVNIHNWLGFFVRFTFYAIWGLWFGWNLLGYREEPGLQKISGVGGDLPEVLRRQKLREALLRHKKLKET